MKELTRLRELTPSNAPDLFYLIDRNRPELKKFWWESSTHSVNDSRNFIDAANVSEGADQAVSRGIHVQDRLIGIGSIHHIDRDLSRATLGYWLDAHESGKGYATEVAKRLAEIAFDDLALNELAIDVCVDNRGSRRVAEKTGFELTGVDGIIPWHEPASGDTARVAHYRLTR